MKLVSIFLALTIFIPQFSIAAEKKAHRKSWPRGFWARTGSNQKACNWLGRSYTIKIRVKSKKKSELGLSSLLKRLDAEHQAKDCPDNRNRQVQKSADVWVSKEDIPKLKKYVIEEGDLLSWKKSNLADTGNSDSVIDRWRILTKEVAANKALLTKTPHIKALIQSEINRLQPHYEFRKKFEGRTRFQITFVE